jgi:hypothetical protein
MGPHGSRIITVTGRCSGDSATVNAILENVVTRYQLEPIPQARGVILKALDGSDPEIYEITPSTIGKTWNCVKIAANVTPMAPTQTGGVFNGKSVLVFEQVYQQVGVIDD